MQTDTDTDTTAIIWENPDGVLCVQYKLLPQGSDSVSHRALYLRNE